jgi:DNA transformation protein and related proteins
MTAKSKPSGQTPIADLPGLGPKSAAWLAQIGVHNRGELERIGSIEAMLRLDAAGIRVSLNLLYALEGALQNRSWQDIARSQKSELILALDCARDCAKGIAKDMGLTDFRDKGD